MKPFIRKKLPFILIAAQAVLILGLLLYIVPGRYRLYDIVLYDASENVPPNPLIGYAPPAEREDDCLETDLVFITLSFAEWEPEEGEFDPEGVRRKNHIDEYREAGKHAVLRFVCDVPGRREHADIPDWLLKKTGDGTFYDDPSGKGYAPLYENGTFLKAHGKALQALADWCRQDSFVAYVEAGSVGQNGMWTASAETASAPSPNTLRQYADQYEKAFPADGDILLLYSAGSDLKGTDQTAGTWNDVLGDKDSAEQWMKQITEPGNDEKENAGSAEASPRWVHGPVGGGLSAAVPMEELLMDRLSDTLDQIRSSHVSFIGPAAPDADQQKTNGSEMILRDVGYCIYLSRLQTTMDFLDDDLLLHFTFANIGEAPLYRDWPVTMYIYDRTGECIREQTLDLQLSRLLPGQDLEVTGSVPYSRTLLEGYSVGLSITSPDGRDRVTFAQKGVIPDPEGIHRVYRYKKTGR